MKTTQHVVMSCAAALFLTAPAEIASANPGGPVPLVIEAALPPGVPDLARTGEVATFGLPFAEGEVAVNLDGRPSLALLGGTPAWQADVLETWPDGTVKWALMSIQADVPAGGTHTGLSVQPIGLGESAGADIATESPGLIVLDTGPLQVDIRDGAAFNLFDKVVHQGTTLVDHSSYPTYGVLGTKSDGSLISAANPSTQLTLESNGPARAVVRADGTLRDSSGVDIIDYSCRIVARAGLSDLEVHFTLRNANISRPQHTTIQSAFLAVRPYLGGSTIANFNTHTGPKAFPMAINNVAYLYQAYSSADTDGADGKGPAYKPHIEKVIPPNNDPVYFVEEGYRFVTPGGVFDHPLGDKTLYPDHLWMELGGVRGALSLAVKQAPYQWPVSLDCVGDGTSIANLFTARKAGDFTFVWRQHESRTVNFNFHGGTSSVGAEVAHRLDYPILGRASDYGHYDTAGVFPYRLVTETEQEAAYTAMGVQRTIANNDEPLEVLRFLSSQQGGGKNNFASIERRLGGDWLRGGLGGQYLRGFDIALYKSEWQIERSDNFDHANDPGANNDQVPHTTNHTSDFEHRYREGILLAWYLTGDTRFRDALTDEVEILKTTPNKSQERSFYQTVRAISYLHDFSGDPALLSHLAGLVLYQNGAFLDATTCADGFGWEATPDIGMRRYYINSNQAVSEKGPGENYVTRGFISASFGPIAQFHAARALGTAYAEGPLARGRLRDLAFYTRNELYPSNPDPLQQLLVYSYGVKTQTIYSFQNSNSHPILLGMAEAYLDTVDVGYLNKGIEYVIATDLQDHGGGVGNSDLDSMENRLDVQHFMAIYLDSLP